MADLWFFVVALPIALLLFLASLFDRPVRKLTPVRSPTGFYIPYAVPVLGEDGEMHFTIEAEPKPGAVALYFDFTRETVPPIDIEPRPTTYFGRGAPVSAAWEEVDEAKNWTIQYNLLDVNPDLMAILTGVDVGTDP